MSRVASATPPRKRVDCAQAPRSSSPSSRCASTVADGASIAAISPRVEPVVAPVAAGGVRQRAPRNERFTVTFPAPQIRRRWNSKVPRPSSRARASAEACSIGGEDKGRRAGVAQITTTEEWSERGSAWSPGDQRKRMDARGSLQLQPFSLRGAAEALGERAAPRPARCGESSAALGGPSDAGSRRTAAHADLRSCSWCVIAAVSGNLHHFDAIIRRLQRLKSSTSHRLDPASSSRRRRRRAHLPGESHSGWIGGGAGPLHRVGASVRERGRTSPRIRTGEGRGDRVGRRFVFALRMRAARLLDLTRPDARVRTRFSTWAAPSGNCASRSVAVFRPAGDGAHGNGGQAARK